jgi:hypothetical protein
MRRMMSIVVRRRRRMSLMVMRWGWRVVWVTMGGRRWSSIIIVVQRRLTISSYTLSFGWIGSMLVL